MGEKTKKFILVYNPASGAGKFKERLDGVIRAFQSRKAMLFIYRTEKETSENLLGFVRECKADGIIIAGGDGTLHEIINLLLAAGIRLPVGIIGCGTSNDFATYLKLNDDPEAYFDAIVTGKRRRIDLGRIGGRYFINVASAGVMTSIAHETDVKLKKSLGKLAYYLKGLEEIPKIKSMSLTVEADGVRYESEVILFVIINSAVVGSMKNVAAAKIDDGKLDFLAIKKSGLTGIIKIMSDLLMGKQVSDKDDVLYLQAKTFKVESASPDIISDLDGEPGPYLPIAVETVPDALEIYCP